MKFSTIATLGAGFFLAHGSIHAAEISLEQLDLSLFSSGWGKVQAGKDVDGTPIIMSGKSYEKGLGTHAPSLAVIALDGKATKFSTKVGVNDANPGAVRFRVWGDRKILAESQEMKVGQTPETLSADLSGVKELRLEVDDLGNKTSDHAIWADATITYAGDAPKATLPSEPQRWVLGKDQSTEWHVAESILPHKDFIEQGGRRVGQKVWYAVDADRKLSIERHVVWPSLRIKPNDTHGSYIVHYAAEAEPKIRVDGKELGPIIVDQALLDGTLTFIGKASGLDVKRETFPSFDTYSAWDIWTIANKSGKTVEIAVDPLLLSSEKESPYGINHSIAKSDGVKPVKLANSKTLSFAVSFTASLKGEEKPLADAAAERTKRMDFINGLNQALVLETPDPVLNRAFTFAKWRVSEAMNDTRGGLMLAPGNLRYYAATWCNDNVEYAGPFFPYLGDQGGVDGSLNAYRQYIAFMKPDYKPIPSSVVAEGTSFWNGAGDRGDAAMFAYGASYFCLALGDKTIAEELWKGITWSLEYSKRQLNEHGVVASRTDELEGRLPAGKANLTTSSLYFGALVASADLADSLNKPYEAKVYREQAKTIAAAIESFFGKTLDGFETYRYYEENTTLRSWICMPMSMGIFDRKAGTIDALFSPKMWTPDGLASEAGGKVFWDRSTLYALRAVFQAGETAKALDFLQRYTKRRLLGNHVPYAVEAYPEGGQGHLASESALYCRIFTEGLFGLHPTGLQSLRITPRLPDGWDKMALRNIKLQQRDLDVEVIRQGDKWKLLVTSAGKILKETLLNPGDSLEFSTAK